MEDTLITAKPSAVDALIKLIETLRGKNGCPWDRKQTPRSMAICLVEELYELLDAIESDRPEDICEELGDVLFHVFFMAKLFQEMGHFNTDDVAAVVVEKMTRRHPHVFSNKKLATADDVKKQWQTLKMKENKPTTGNSLLDSIPSRLPSLIRAYRISERVSRAGFDWNDISGVFKKAELEWDELKSAIRANDHTQKQHINVSLEFGDLLFTLVNVARFAKIHPETALNNAIKKFEKRFACMERIVSETGRSLGAFSDEEVDMLWTEAKKKTDDYDC